MQYNCVAYKARIRILYVLLGTRITTQFIDLSAIN